MSESFFPFFFFFFLETASPYIAQATQELMILLAQPPECWDYQRKLQAWFMSES
jgi:hypothetical protein